MAGRHISGSTNYLTLFDLIEEQADTLRDYDEELIRKKLNGALAEWFAQRRLIAHVSLSDESDYAAAFVVVETMETL